MITPECTQ